ncbi:hypothetical protein MKZ38_000380 [Zalerion maritima]|uniref:Uncharacterized protein n=1 Tax=Zalerion maritima TaxID=339359 RepID=A0AAD5WUM6_9PEZI|nr:hypothetical protein MKZ38_000380 [Zalerion maritima]
MAATWRTTWASIDSLMTGPRRYNDAAKGPRVLSERLSSGTLLPLDSVLFISTTDTDTGISSGINIDSRTYHSPQAKEISICPKMDIWLQVIAISLKALGPRRVALSCDRRRVRGGTPGLRSTALPEKGFVFHGKGELLAGLEDMNSLGMNRKGDNKAHMRRTKADTMETSLFRRQEKQLETPPRSTAVGQPARPASYSPERSPQGVPLKVKAPFTLRMCSIELVGIWANFESLDINHLDQFEMTELS